jgi:hypothetical protein
MVNPSSGRLSRILSGSDRDDDSSRHDSLVQHETDGIDDSPPPRQQSGRLKKNAAGACC